MGNNTVQKALSNKKISSIGILIKIYPNINSAMKSCQTQYCILAILSYEKPILILNIKITIIILHNNFNRKYHFLSFVFKPLEVT